jgi:outer membrane protein assembly factor BamB
VLTAVQAINGTPAWTFENPGSSFSAGPVVGEGVVYLTLSNDQLLGELVALDLANQQPRWRVTLPSEAYASPALWDNTLYVAILAGKLLALEASTGQQRWEFATSETVFSSPAIAEGLVYFGSWDENLYAVDGRSGQQRWLFTTGGGVSSPAVHDGVVYVGSDNGVLYAIPQE